jgi:hypothetical protein
MKPLLVLFTIALLSLGFAACGGTSKGTDSASSSSSSATTNAGVSKKDRDDDGDNNDDDNQVLYYGHAPSAAERRPIVALVTSYYTAAAAEDGAKACALLMPFVAESVVEDIGHSPGLQGKTCAAVMSKLFRAHHALLSGESSTLKFYSVRAGDGKALTVLSVANLPEVRQLIERRDSSGAWRVLSLLDGIVE